MYQKIGYDRQPVQVVLRRSKQVGYGALTAPPVGLGAKVGRVSPSVLSPFIFPLTGDELSTAEGALAGAERKKKKTVCTH